VSRDPWGQTGHRVRFDWGPVGAARTGGRECVSVIVDVLSFTTAVTVAVESGSAVYPAPPGADAVALAREAGAELAVGRDEVTEERPWSLSPQALRSAAIPARLVLPSPNGSAIASAAGGVVVAACLRNASAVAAWLADRRERVAVIAAGERWPDGSLRPALEDLLGAGAVLAALAERDLSPEARAARAVYEGTPSVPEAVRGCASAIELIDAGFGADVEIAVELDASRIVPVLGDGAFRGA
jgi:2-phosphosulfolactate phosphatase